jgi:hypothetical protein
MKLSPKLLLPALFLAAAGTAGIAQIQRLNLEQMVGATDDAVYAEIVGKRVFRIDHPVDGPELYFTTLTLQGRSLENGKSRTVEVTYPGGFINETEGVYNSEAPSAEDTRIGNKVVVFFGWLDNMGGEVSGNRLWASHGGLYRTVEGPQETVVLGRGNGYAISTNRKLNELDTAIRTLAQTKKQR